jgi:hypothetical protein
LRIQSSGGVIFAEIGWDDVAYRWIVIWESAFRRRLLLTPGIVVSYNLTST